MAIAADAIALERILLATPSGSNVRWSDQQLLTLTDRGVKRLVAEVLFPETRLTIQTQPNLQEYQLPPEGVHVIHRVWVNGQAIPPTPGGIETLQGDQILQYDQTGNYGVMGQNTAAAVSSGTFQPFGNVFSTSNPAGAVLASGAPAGSGGAMQPQWTIQTPVAYPFLNSWGVPAPEAQPWFPGQRPRYYINGGAIGLQPAPLATAWLVIDCVKVPETLVTTEDQMVVPDNFVDGITSYVMWRAASAYAMNDRSPAAAANRADALNELIAEERKLRTWKRQFTQESNQTFVLTYRGAFQVGGYRTDDGGW